MVPPLDIRSVTAQLASFKTDVFYVSDLEQGGHINACHTMAFYGPYFVKADFIDAEVVYDYYASHMLPPAYIERCLVP